MNKFKVIVKKISPFIKPYRWAFFGAIIFIISAAIFNALAPVTEGLIITQLTEDSFNIMKGIEGAGVDFGYVIKVMIVLGGVYVSSTASTYIASFLLTNAIQNTVKGLRNAVQDKIRRLPISYFDGNSYGDVLSRITNDIDTISNALQQSFVQVVNSFLSITLALIMMFTINIKMAFIAVFIIPLSILVSRFIVSKSQNLFYRQQKALGKLNGKVQEMLKDIAKVEMVDNSSDMYAKINGNDGVILAFQKQSTSSTAEVSDKVNEKIEQLQEKDSNLHITPLQDQGVYINIVISSVLNNLVLGGLLAVVILFVFLKNIKPTIIIALSIPISLLFAVAMMYFSGVTMNVISLAGLALGVGMLVDNSIVVIENIYRLRNEGMGIKKAAVQGASQVAGAIVASTLTTICVFLPIVFTDGLSRQLFTDMGLTIAYSLIASLIVALTLVPTISSKVLTNLDEKEHGLFDRFVNFYEGLLRKALRYKWGVLGAVAILLVISFIGVMTKGMILMPEMDSLQISVTMSMEKDTSQSDLREMSNKVIERITEIDDVETVGAMESGAGSLMGGQSKSISYYVLLNEDKKATSKEVSKEIAEKTKDLNCDLKINSSTMDMSALGGSGVEVKIKGDNLDTLKSMAKDIAGILESVEGTKEIQNGLDEGSMETKITVDKNKAMEHGLTVAQVYQDIASAIKSESNSTTLNLNSKEYPVVLVNDDAKSLTKEKLNNYEIISTVNGEEKKIKLTDIAVISEEESLSSINRENQVRNISVKAGVDSDHNVGLVSDDVEKKLSTYNVPEGYTVEMGGEKESMDSTYSDLVSMLLLAIVFIYAIMVAQFQSFLSPFIVLFTIPLAFTGGLLALLLTGFNLSMIAMLGFLVLAGVVVNNGIVFVDYVNQLRLEGVDKKEALIIAGRTRIRPILMTALTTILGLSTLAMGIGMGSDMIQPMAIVTIGGLTYATILTLFVVPIMYDILHRKELKPIEVD